MKAFFVFSSKRNLSWFFVGIFLLYLLSSCLYTPGLRQGKVYEESPIFNLKKGMRKDEVLYHLGSPVLVHGSPPIFEYWYRIRTLEESREDIQDITRSYRPNRQLIIEFDNESQIKAFTLKKLDER